MKDLEIINEYRLLDKELSLYSDKLRGARDYETSLFIPDINYLESVEKELKELKNKVISISVNDDVTNILQNHFKDFVDGQELNLKGLYERPSVHISIFTNTFMNMIRYDSRPDIVKAEILMDRFKQADKVWDGILTWIDRVALLYLRELIDSCNLFINTMKVESKKLPKYFPNLNENQLNELLNVIQEISYKMEGWIEFAKEIMAANNMMDADETSETDTIKFDESYYRFVLNNNFGIDLDELLSWYEEEVEKTRNEVFKIASKLKISDPIPKTMKEVNDILLKYAGPCDTPEEMYARANEYIKRTRAVCHEFVNLPSDEICIVNETPEQYKFSWPWGGYGGGCPRRRPLIGEMFLNRYNYKAVTDGWIKMNTVHESYPGHHAQFVRATLDPIPETMKRGAKSIPLMEGTAHRSERAFEFIFGEDQFYPLFVAYRRHHTSVRIKSDLWLRYFGRPIGDAVQLYVDELDFDRNTARGQVKQQEEMQGYFTNYYYGMKKLSDWEKSYGYSKKDFTELLFSPGRISLQNFEKFLKLSEEDKSRLLNDYASLLQFKE